MRVSLGHKLGAAIALMGAAWLAACSEATPRVGRAPVQPGDDFYEEEPPLVPSEPDSVNPNGFQASERPAPGPADAGVAPSDAAPAPDSGDAGAPRPDSGPIDASVEAGPPAKVYCGALAPGDLVITEFLISSRAGSNDDAEWIELSSTRTCTLKLDGVVVESPKGTAFDAVTLPVGTEAAPLGKLLVVGSAAGARALGLPQPTFALERTDVLKNDGDRLTVRVGATIIDRLDYPAFSNVTPSRSVAFPANCPASARTDWSRWSLTFATYAGGAQRGTPGRDNTDVTCY